MDIENLKQIRQNPRMMREQYLASSGWLSVINEKTHGEEFTKFKTKDKIDYILNGEIKHFCYCGNLLKPNTKFCSPQCTGNALENKARVAGIQRSNAKERYAKSIATNIAKYGVAHNQLHPDVQAKTKSKRLKYYDAIRKGAFIERGVDLDFAYNVDAVKSALDDCTSYTELCDRYFNGITKTLLIRHIRDTLAIDHFYPKTGSYAERQIAEYIRSLGVSVIQNDRKFLDGDAKKLEIDILCPEEKIAIEYDGVYTHQGVEPNLKSKKKRCSCDSQDFQFIRIYEYEWEENQDLIKSVLASKFGKFQRRLFARQCTVSLISTSEARSFLENNHLQGFMNGTHYGLRYYGELVSIFTIGKPRFKNKYSADFELLRYATKRYTQVIGGFSKLLVHAKKQIGVDKKIITYCDLRWSNGKTYEKYGCMVGETARGYCWVNKYTNEKYSRHQTQKHKLQKLLGEKFNPDQTEIEIMEAANFVQLWDDGNLIFIL